MAIDNALGFLRSLGGSQRLSDAIVVFGPHGFLRETVVSAVAARLTAQTFQYRSFQVGAGGDFSGVLDELDAADLFAAKRLVVCRVLKSHRDRGGEEETEDEEAAPSRGATAGGEAALAEAIENGTAPNHLVLVYERDNAPARIRKTAARSSAMVACLRPFDNQVPDYIRTFARIRGLKLSSETANFLAERHAGDLAAIANALDKAAVSCDWEKPLGPDDFGEAGSRKMPDIFEIADSLARGRAAGALGQIDRALAFGRDPIEILAVEVIPVMRRMMIAASMLARRRGAGEIAAAIGGSPTSGLVARALDGARRFGLERLQKSYARATQLDEDFKNGNIKEREQALGALLLELMG